MSQDNIEVELRYKVDDPELIIAKLKGLGVIVASREHLIDQWFLPKTVMSLEEQKEWFDVQHGLAWRIRRIERPDGSMKVKVESKQLTHHNNHDTFIEGVANVADYEAGLQMMAGLDYKNWLTIDKTRLMFNSGHSEMEVVLDEIAGLKEAIGVGAGLEIEFKGQATRDEALQKLEEFAAKLELDASDRFDKSLTVESMTALARF